MIQGQILAIRKRFEATVCSLNPTAFWERHTWEVELPYKEGFGDQDIPSKARAVQMSEK